MGLLHEIQADVLREGADLGPILLKLRLLAARLGSEPLAEWVRHESEGYPQGADVPDYRIVSVQYTADFSGPFNSGIKNAPIPPYLIRKIAGAPWVKYEVRGSVAVIDNLLASPTQGSTLSIDASDLILILQGKVYPEYSCISVSGKISPSVFEAIRHSVRSRVLELTIQLEKSIPEAAAVALGSFDAPVPNSSAAATQIAQQIIYGNFTSVAALGDGAQIAISIAERDTLGLAKLLAEAGILDEDAKELARLASAEEPESKVEPMGPKVRTWVADNLKKAASGTWKVGVTVATDVIKEALLKYYGLK